MHRIQYLYQCRHDKALRIRFASKCKNLDNGRNWEWLYPKYLQMKIDYQKA